MGFIGKIRAIIAKSATSTGYDAAAISNALVKEAKLASPVTDISGFFSKNFIKEVNNTPFIGNSKLLEFSSFARRGDYTNSFKKAFPTNPGLANVNVRSALNKLLVEAQRTLPDFRMKRNENLVESATKGFGVEPKSLRSADDLAKAAKSNPKLATAVNQLVARAKSGKAITAFGVAVTVGIAATAGLIYEKMAQLAQEMTGCNAYWTDQNGNVTKCKVSQYSCKYSDKGKLCMGGSLPTSITDNKDCQQDANKDKICIHCDADDKVNVDLPENIVLKCEEKTAGDMLLDTIGNTLGDVWGGVVGSFQTIFIVGAIFLVIVIVLVIVINFIR